MATSHELSDVLLGQAGGSEFGVIGNVKEFCDYFWKKYGFVLRYPVAYIKCAYLGGHSEHKFEMAPGYLVLTRYGLIFFSRMPEERFIIHIPFNAIDWNLMFIESKGFQRLALTSRNRDKFLASLENMDITLESKKILSNLPDEAAALARQKYNKKEINYFVSSIVNFAAMIKKRTLHIPYANLWGLQKPKFFLGLTCPGIDEFIYAWAKVMLMKPDVIEAADRKEEKP